MSKNNVVEISGREKIHDKLTDLIREGASKLIAQGLELEVSELLAALCGRRDEMDRAAVVRNGYQPATSSPTNCSWQSMPQRESAGSSWRRSQQRVNPQRF